jgi:multiple antibiotic resistance protein
MNTAELITFATAMFAIMNPIGSVAIFMGMVADRTEAERRSIAIRSAIAIAVILVGTVWVGEFVLRLFGVGIPSLQAAGGIMIALIALSMLHSSPSPIHDTKGGAEAPSAGQDIAVVPLAMPMVAGPGSIVTVIVNTHQYRGIESNLKMSAVLAVMAILIGTCFLAAGPIGRVLGGKGLDILTKFMGLVLLAIAMGMLASGIKGLLPGLAG